MVDWTLRLAAWITDKTNPPVENVAPVRARAQLRRLTQTMGRLLMAAGPASIVAEDRVLGGVSCRVYRPSLRRELMPAVIYFHGGGWVVGDLDTHDGVCRCLAQATQAIVIAVNYRLAPESAFPAAYDDALAVTQAVMQQAAALGLRAESIAVAGDSAGGNLAAAVALHARDQKWRIAAQLLIYPVLDTAAEAASYERFATGHFLTREAMRYYIRSYLPQPDDRLLPQASPLRAPSLSGVAPAMVITAEADVLRDEALAYVAALQRDGVPAEHLDAAGMLHGFFNLLRLPTPRRVFDESARWLATRLS